MTVPEDILCRAYELAGDEQDTVLLDLRGIDWGTLTNDLEFYPSDTGGGMQMLVADSEYDLQVLMTDGEAGVPTDAEDFWLALSDGEDELFSMVVRNGVLE
ncbi:hypothetical protein [Deinococcus sp. QL22]|uniref:hypothetical protein n=1 Tax=Deinococcus sp. QL22 TaxID=2939437 RepID=UPI0020178881|nr:hypothetical protein [Deinococcus sp. QL22]UQN08821.1 hypothetical protein M1R55_19645 [Deinococcus sp. QL22]